MAKPSTASRSYVPRREPVRNTSDFWAFLTICAFPLGMIIADGFGVGAFGSLAWGAIGSFAVLVVNIITETRLWMFDPNWRARFEHPDFSFRIAVITGAVLLILQTSLVVLVATDGMLDKGLMNLIMRRQCAQPAPGFQQFCEIFSQGQSSSNNY